MRTLAALTLLAATLTGCGTDTATVAAAPSPVTANGDGCPQGTAVIVTEGDTTTVTYASFNAQAGTGTPATQGRRFCQLAVPLKGAGQKGAVTVTNRGTVSLPEGTSGSQRTSYYIQATPATVTKDHPFTAPRAGDYEHVDANPITLPCGETRNLNVKVELRAGSPGIAAIVAAQSTTVALTWAAC